MFTSDVKTSKYPSHHGIRYISHQTVHFSVQLRTVNIQQFNVILFEIISVISFNNRVRCTGDSITAGFGILGRSVSWIDEFRYSHLSVNI
jgi:hypothetical protein